MWKLRMLECIHLASTSSLRVVVPCVVESHNNKKEQEINDPEVNNELVVEQLTTRNSIKKIS